MARSRAKSHKSAQVTVGNKANVDAKTRAKSDKYKESKSRLVPVPLIAAAGVIAGGAALSRAKVNFKYKYYQHKLSELQDQQQSNGDAISAAYNSVMRRSESKYLQKKLRKYQEKRERNGRLNKALGASVVGAARSLGQMASVRTRRSALSQVRGSSGGMDRRDIVAMNEIYSDDNFVASMD